jgi:hypothetical protein
MNFPTMLARDPLARVFGKSCDRRVLVEFTAEILGEPHGIILA